MGFEGVRTIASVVRQFLLEQAFFLGFEVETFTCDGFPAHITSMIIRTHWEISYREAPFAPQKKRDPVFDRPYKT